MKFRDFPVHYGGRDLVRYRYSRTLEKLISVFLMLAIYYEFLNTCIDRILSHLY